MGRLTVASLDNHIQYEEPFRVRALVLDGTEERRPCSLWSMSILSVELRAYVLYLQRSAWHMPAKHAQLAAHRIESLPLEVPGWQAFSSNTVPH